VPQRVSNIGDRLTTHGEHRRHIHPHPTAVMTGANPDRAKAADRACVTVRSRVSRCLDTTLGDRATPWCSSEE
jgi:hypothetical protein